MKFSCSSIIDANALVVCILHDNWVCHSVTVWVFTWSSWYMCSWVYPCRLSLSLIQSNHPWRRPQNWPPLDSPMTTRVGLDLQAVSCAVGHLVPTWWACCHGDESLAVILGMTFLQPFHLVIGRLESVFTIMSNLLVRATKHFFHLAFITNKRTWRQWNWPPLHLTTSSFPPHAHYLHIICTHLLLSCW
jgi:hypothetical protein